MSNYGRNFEFRVTPIGQHRSARHSTPTTGTRIPIGAPVEVDASAAVNAILSEVVILAEGAVDPMPGRTGILVWEAGPNAFAGSDQLLTTSSDIDTAPLGAQVQMVYGNEVKVVLRNTVDRTFLQTREYAGRTMVAGLGATPTLAEGNFLRPHDTPSDDDGYWQETADEAEAWLVITSVDAARREVEARMLF